MFGLLYDPIKEIMAAKEQNFVKILVYLVAASLFEGAGILFIAWRYLSQILQTNVLVEGVLIVLFTLIIAHLVIAFFFSLAMHILDGKGGYYEGLTTLVLAMVAPAVALFFGGALMYVPMGIFVSIPLIIYGYVVGAATLFRCAKELFEIDYAGVLVGFLITFATMIVSVLFFVFIR